MNKLDTLTTALVKKLYNEDASTLLEVASTTNYPKLTLALLTKIVTMESIHKLIQTDHVEDIFKKHHSYFNSTATRKVLGYGPLGEIQLNVTSEKIECNVHCTMQHTIYTETTEDIIDPIRLDNLEEFKKLDIKQVSNYSLNTNKDKYQQYYYQELSKEDISISMETFIDKLKKLKDPTYNTFIDLLSE